MIGGEGGMPDYSYMRVPPDEFLLKMIVLTIRHQLKFDKCYLQQQSFPVDWPALHYQLISLHIHCVLLHDYKFGSPDEYSCGYTLLLHVTTLSGRVLDHQSVQVFNLLRKCTSAGQKFVRFRVHSNWDEYLHGSVSDSCFKLCIRHFIEDPSNTRSHPKTAEQIPKEFIRTMRCRVNGEPAWENINISAKLYPDKILLSAV